MEDYELLTLMLSALAWRRHNGEIRMVTDSAGAVFFEHAGLAELWSEPVDTALDGMDETLDPFLFWAAGKLEALRRTDAPCVMLDTDLIIWKDIRERLSDHVVTAHREALEPAVYPDPRSAFLLAPGYSFPPEWDFSVPAANTAFLYLPDAALKDAFTGAAYRFMRALRGGNLDPTVTMCFAEQRILPMCAAAASVGIDTLLDANAPDEQDFVTHLWGAKRVLAASRERRVAYCLGCVSRILADFPAWEGVLAANPQTAPYLSAIVS